MLTVGPIDANLICHEGRVALLFPAFVPRPRSDQWFPGIKIPVFVVDVRFHRNGLTTTHRIPREWREAAPPRARGMHHASDLMEFVAARIALGSATQQNLHAATFADLDSVQGVAGIHGGHISLESAEFQ